jgi:CRP/FNR family cyclic AMP-dependent transcriptional regulator
MDSAIENSASIPQFLNSLPLFERVSPGSQEMIVKGCRIKLAPRGTFLFLRGDPADAVYILREGAILIHIESLEGRALVINEIGKGDCFGELGVLTGQPHSANAEAFADSEVLVIPALIFNYLIENEAGFVLELLRITALRLMASSRREESLAFMDARERLARLLLQLDKQTKDKGYITLSQEELAQRTGLTRQTVAAILGEWRRNGWLLTGRGYIVILNRGAMNLLVENLETSL